VDNGALLTRVLVIDLAVFGEFEPCFNNFRIGCYRAISKLTPVSYLFGISRVKVRGWREPCAVNIQKSHRKGGSFVCLVEAAGVASSLRSADLRFATATRALWARIQLSAADQTKKGHPPGDP
jgi:hypothetical protein